MLPSYCQSLFPNAVSVSCLLFCKTEPARAASPLARQTRTLNIKNLPPPLNQNIINCPSIGDRKDYPGAIEANCTARER